VTVSRQEPDKMQIRARAREDLERLAEFAKNLGWQFGPVIETPQADYRYRLLIKRDEWPALAHDLAEDVDYSNFKNEIHDPYRHRLYEDVWQTMYGLQIRSTRANHDLAAGQTGGAQRLYDLGELDAAQFSPEDLGELDAALFEIGPGYLEDLQADNLPGLPDELDPESPFFDPGRYPDNDSPLEYDDGNLDEEDDEWSVITLRMTAP